jgi:hypothetical protein
LRINFSRRITWLLIVLWAGRRITRLLIVLRRGLHGLIVSLRIVGLVVLRPEHGSRHQREKRKNAKETGKSSHKTSFGKHLPKRSAPVRDGVGNSAIVNVNPEGAKELRGI